MKKRFGTKLLAALKYIEKNPKKYALRSRVVKEHKTKPWVVHWYAVSKERK